MEMARIAGNVNRGNTSPRNKNCEIAMLEKTRFRLELCNEEEGCAEVDGVDGMK